MADGWFLALGVLLLLLAVGSWFWLARRVIDRRRRLRTWPRATATVLEARHRTESHTIQGQTQRHVVYTGTYEFTDPGGQVRTGRSEGPTRLVPGGTIEVVFDPADPDTSDVVVARRILGDVLLVGAVSANLVLFGVPALMIGLGG